MAAPCRRWPAPRPALAAALLALALAQAFVPRASAQLKRLPDSFGDLTSAEQERARQLAFLEGTHVFRRILFDLKLQALGSFAELEGVKPSDTLLVVLGATDSLAEVPGGLQAWVRGGGAVLVATDLPVEGGKDLASLTGVTVGNRSRWPINAAPEDCYRRLPDCPVVRPVRGATPDLFRSPRVDAAGPLQVATNVPAYLYPVGERPPGIEPLAQFPPGTYFRGLPPFWAPRLFAVGGEVGDGRVLFLADHSIFINQMMLPSDNGNVEFTYNCLRWLQGTGDLRRRVLFVEDGRVNAKLDIPLKDVHISLADLAQEAFARRNQILAGAEQALTNMENEGAFDRWLEEHGATPRNLARVALLLGSGVLLAYLFVRVGIRARFRSEPTLSSLGKLVGQHAPTASLLEQRYRAQLRAGNLWETARALARRALLAAGVPAPAPGVAAQPPHLRVQGGWWQRRRVARRFRHAWQLAYSPIPVRVSPAALPRLVRHLEWLQSALAAGSVRLSEDDKVV